MKNNNIFIGYIYKIYNDVNKKLYIGQTTTSIEHRFKDHIYQSNSRNTKGMAICNAIKKYGADNFHIEQVERVECFSKEELIESLNKKEIYYISLYNSQRPNGYNVTEGGNNISPRAKRKVDQYTKNGEYIRTFNSLEEALQSVVPGKTKKNNIASVCSGKTKTAYGFVWRYHGDDINKYPIEKKECRIKVDQYDLNGVFLRTFESASGAAKHLGKFSKNGKGNSAHIVACCKGQRPRAYGFIWRYHSDNLHLYSTILKKKHKEVNQYSLNGILLRTFFSIKEASKITNTCETGIIECCKNRQKTSGGYRWTYADN